MDPEDLTPAFLNQPPQEYLGPNGLLRYYINERGERLATYYWPATTATPSKAVLLVVHGHGSYVNYEYLKFQVRCRATSNLTRPQRSRAGRLDS